MYIRRVLGVYVATERDRKDGGGWYASGKTHTEAMAGCLGLIKKDRKTMKTKTITLYEYSELSEKSKEKALEYYRENMFDHYGLQVEMDNAIEPLLEMHGIKPVATADRKYPSSFAKIYYSLSNSQGDGAMFEGTFEWNTGTRTITVNVKQSGRYYHSHSKEVDMPEASEAECARFEKIYQSICEELERVGYAYIEDVQSEAHFIEDCNVFEWLFREDGTREDL